MPTTRLTSAVTSGARNSFTSKGMPSCVSEKLSCEVCGKGFNHAAVLGRHRSLHRKEDVSVKHLLTSKNFPCSACGKVFKNDRTFDCHVCNYAKTKSRFHKDLKLECGLSCKDGSVFQDIDIKSSRIQTKDANKTQSKTVSKSPVVHGKNIKSVRLNNSPSSLKVKSESVEKKKGRRRSSRHTCKMCLKNFSSESKLQKHATLHDPSKPFRCDVCGKFFDDAQYMETHRTRHEKRSRKECNICGKVFNERIFYDIHCLTHVEQKPFRCDLNNSPSSLEVNSESVKGRRRSSRHTCKMCHKNFSSKSKLQKHAILHDPSKPFRCDVCGKFFDDARFMKTHRTLHEKKSRKECNICGKVFNERIFYDIHCLTHVEQKPFRCDVCEDIFKDKTTFQRHYRKHKARTRKVAERFLSMKEVLKQKLEDSNRQN